MNNGIQVIYPRTKYLTVNEEIFSYIEKKIHQFMIFAKEAIQENLVYTLDIAHDEYHYQDYVSYVFYVSSYTGGNNSEHSIYSIVYDTVKNKIIHLSDLVQEKEQILSIFSLKSREVFSKNSNVVDTKQMLEGTTEELSNFSVFAFTPTGILLFFPENQIAPAYAFKVNVAYSELGK